MDYSVKSHSWNKIDDNIVTKRTDKSALHHRESTIPIEFRYFFRIDDMLPDTQKDITLYVEDKEISGRLVCRYRRSKKAPEGSGIYTKITWNQYLSDLLKKNFKHYPDFNSEDVPILIFERSDEEYYNVTIESGTDFCEEKLLFEDYRDDLYESYADGKETKVYTTRYERDPRNRENAIRAHGRRCMVCDFDFEENYGNHGVGFIEVHHKTPVSEYEGELFIDPVQDMACLCSNCHRMIHRRKNNTLSVEELQEYYDKAQEKKRKNQL